MANYDVADFPFKFNCLWFSDWLLPGNFFVEGHTLWISISGCIPIGAVAIVSKNVGLQFLLDLITWLLMCTSSLLNCVQSRFESQVQLAFLIWNLVSVSLHHQKLAFKLVRETLLIRMPLFVEKSYQSESPSILKGSSSFLACQFSSSTFTIILLNLFSLTSKTPDHPFSTCVSHASVFLPFLFFFFLGTLKLR